jgi:hypothetical protein
MKRGSTESPRRPYAKPRIRTIELAADEVLGVGCKNGASSAAPSMPDPCGLSAHCAALGS